MPKGPRGEKRPADVICAAIFATWEEPEDRAANDARIRAAISAGSRRSLSRRFISRPESDRIRARLGLARPLSAWHMNEVAFDLITGRDAHLARDTSAPVSRAFCSKDVIARD